MMDKDKIKKQLKILNNIDCTKYVISDKDDTLDLKDIVIDLLDTLETFFDSLDILNLRIAELEKDKNKSTKVVSAGDHLYK